MKCKGVHDRQSFGRQNPFLFVCLVCVPIWILGSRPFILIIFSPPSITLFRRACYLLSTFLDTRLVVNAILSRKNMFHSRDASRLDSYLASVMMNHLFLMPWFRLLCHLKDVNFGETQGENLEGQVNFV
jgi:hypothetical protein